MQQRRTALHTIRARPLHMALRAGLHRPRLGAGRATVLAIRAHPDVFTLRTGLGPIVEQELALKPGPLTRGERVIPRDRQKLREQFPQAPRQAALLALR